VGGVHAKKRIVGGEVPTWRPRQTASSIAMFVAPSEGSVTSRRQIRLREVSVTDLASHGIAVAASPTPRAVPYPPGFSVTDLPGCSFAQPPARPPEPIRAVTSISIRIRGSASPAEIIMAAGRISPK
jgi:hypothetical protein